MSSSRFPIALLLAVPSLVAQADIASLRGVVTDSSGAAIRTVTLVVTETGTAMTREAVSAENGAYEIPYLKPGVYSVTIERRRGYQSYAATGIELLPGQARRFDPVLTAGTLNQTQETDESGKTTRSERGSVSGVIDYRARWSDAPVVDRRNSPLPLLVSGPGVQGNGRGLVIAASSRNRQTWGADGIPQDAVGGAINANYFEAVNVTLANPSVEMFRPVGFEMISRRGIDTWHGSAYYRYGSSALDARSYFDSAKVPYRLNEVGGEAGGALIPKSTYVYGGWTYQKDKRTETLYADVPTTKMRSGDFSQLLNPATAPNGVVTVIRDPRTGTPFSNNQIPGSRISSVANNLLTNYYPSPSVDNADQLRQNYSWIHSFGRDAFTAQWPFFRVDQKLSGSNNLYLRFMQAGTTAIYPGSVGETLASTQQSRQQSWAFSDTHAFSSNLLNRLKFGWIGNSVHQGQEEQDITPLSGSSVVGTIGLQGVNVTGFSAAGFPSIAVSGFTGLSMQAAGGANEHLAHKDRAWTLEDSIAWVKGRHTVQLGAFGMGMRWQDGTVPQSVYGAFTFSGAFSGYALSDFLLGLPGTSSRSQAKVNRPIEQTQVGLFASDTFRVSRRLTLDYGLRWDYFGSPRYEDGFMSSWDASTGAVVVAPGTITSVSSLYPASIRVTTGQVVPTAKHLNFRPRVSAAYRLTENAILRGGYGQFTAAAAYGVDGLLSPTNPYWLTESYTNSITNGTAALSFPSPFPSTPTSSQTPSQSVTALPSRANEGVIRQFNATLERAIGRGSARLSYIGARGSRMNYSVDINKPQASTTPFSNSRKPYPQFANTVVIRNDGLWHYDAAQVQVSRRVGSLLFDTNLTWGNNVANYLNTIDPYHITDKWTRDAADRRLYFTTSASWDLPIGKGKRLLSQTTTAMDRLVGNWTVHAIVTAASGQFYTPVFTGPDPANASAGFVTQPADCIGDPTAGAGTISRWFNPSAIAVPPPSGGRYGTCGMNSLAGYPIHVGHVSLAKRFPLGEQLRAVFTAQISNVTNTPHFTTPNANISTGGAGAFSASSAVDSYSPERLGYRQIHLKLRLEW